MEKYVEKLVKTLKIMLIYAFNEICVKICSSFELNDSQKYFEVYPKKKKKWKYKNFIPI